jgi:catechol 2,3-dioxygenase-like lactoylglutathione lyase family enzyme
MVWSYQVVFDCNERPMSLAEFWAAALDYEEPDWPPQVRAMVDAHPEWQRTRGVAQDAKARHPRLFLQLVPEPRPAHNRIRFEIEVPGPDLDAEVERLRSLGAAGSAELMTDPEGNEFTVRLGAPGGSRRWRTVLIDAVDPDAAVDFWSRMLGFERDGTRCHPPVDWANPLAPSLQFERADEPKTRKNAVHFDVNVTDHDDWVATRDRLLAMGAVVCDPAEFGLDMPNYGNNFAIMRDPDGNEFCLQATSEPHDE